MEHNNLKKKQVALMKDWHCRDKAFWNEVRKNLILGKSELMTFDAVAAFFTTLKQMGKIK